MQDWLMTETSIRWSDLVELISGPGRGIPSLRGEVFIRDVDRPIDDLLQEDEPPSAAGVVDVPDVGRRLAVESHLVVEASRSRLRVAQADGSMCFIWGADTTWIWERDGTVTSTPRDYGRVGSPVSELVMRRELDEWDGDDFTRPASPPTACTFLDRLAWQVNLIPPARKRHQHPVTMVVDAETGLVLSSRNDGFTSVTEWTKLEVGVELDDDRFTRG
jgi:hypothetical protein